MKLLKSLKDIWVFGSARYDEPLLNYVAFRLDDTEDNKLSSTRNKLFLLTFVILIFVASISIMEHFLLSDAEDIFLIDTSKHSSLEIFCGLISIIIGLILSWEYLASGKKNVLFLVLAFFSIGILDLFHGFSDHDHNTFVWFHSFSAFFGSVFLFGSIFVSDKVYGPDNSVWVRRFYVLFGTFVILVFAVLSIKWDSFIPSVLEISLPYRTPVSEAKGHFSSFIYSLNFVSSMLYLFTGFIFFKGFIKTNDVIYLIFGASAMLFFESEILFTFSKLWDPMWWYWHIIKVIIFSGLLIGLAYGFTKTVYTLHTSKIKLANLLEEIEKKNIEIGKAYESLKETQKYLNESEKLASMGKMAAMVAHEIRNPLGAITNSLGVLRRYSFFDPEDRELVQIVENEMERLHRLTEEFLSFSKPSNLKRRKTDLHEVIDETLSILNFDGKSSRGITINRSLDGKIPLLMLDRNHIKQILLNIFINAVQAMPDGGDLTLSTRYKKSENEVELTVADTGIGMSEEVLSHIFQPFFTTKDKGIGLGLNIVHKTVKEHGGYVLISSEKGKGTQIQLNFPVVPRDLSIEPVKAFSTVNESYQGRD